MERGRTEWPVVLAGESIPILPSKDLLSLCEREGKETGMRGKGADGGKGRFAASFHLLKSTYHVSQGKR